MVRHRETSRPRHRHRHRLRNLAAPPPAARAATPVVPTLPVSALRPGQHAIVRTVFAGDSIETFTADIVGVMSGGRADGDIILARATSARVESCGVAAGMSGSPVYVDGKLIGALSMGWPFSKEPIFGITPIGEMLRVLDETDSPHPDGTSGPTGVDPRRGSARYGACSGRAIRSRHHVRQGPPRRPARLPLPLAAGGLSPEVFEPGSGPFPGQRLPADAGRPRHAVVVARSAIRWSRAAPSRWTCCAATSTSPPSAR